MSAARKQLKRKNVAEKLEKTRLFDFSDDEVRRELNGSEGKRKEDECPLAEKVVKKRLFADRDESGHCAANGKQVMSMEKKYGADISESVKAKKKHQAALAKNDMKGSQEKLERLLKKFSLQRQEMMEQYTQRFSVALQQWEAEAQTAEKQEEKLNNLFRQQQKILQKARVEQNRKLKTVRELYEKLVKNIERMEDIQETFVEEAQQELKREMTTLQKKLLMDSQQQERASIRKSLHSFLF